MRSEDPRDSQQHYWNRNLDPQNLGSVGSQQIEIGRERPFYLTPDQSHALAQIAPGPGRRILEVGCGLGVNAFHLAETGAGVVAMDIAAQRLRAVQSALTPAVCERIMLVQASAEALPFRTESFDGAYSKSVLIHTRLERSVPELHRVLNSGGVVCCIEPLSRNPLVNLYRRTLAPKEWQSIVTYFSNREIEHFRRLFSRVYVQNFYWLGFLAFVWQFAVRSPAAFHLSQKLLQPIDSVLFRIPYFRNTAWFAVITARKE